MKRPSLEDFLTARGRRHLYGRRKTGKTFYTRKVLIVPDASTVPETELEAWDAHTLRRAAVMGVTRTY